MAGSREGVPNKASSDRIAKAKAEGPLPADALLLKMRWWLMQYQSAMQEQAQGATFASVKDKIVEALDKAAEAAKDAAPYYHHRLSSIALDVTKRLDLSGLKDDELDFLESIARRTIRPDTDLDGDPTGTGSSTH